tara:strand:+ start:328 stop:591 length:264 start_codon:yes stop_codon:yes gene_type:complete
MLIFASVMILHQIKKFFKFNRNKKFLKDKKFLTFNKSNFNAWMNLTKKERYNLSKEESVSNLMRRKVLLKEIRKEYKKISKGTGKKN